MSRDETPERVKAFMYQNGNIGEETQRYWWTLAKNTDKKVWSFWRNNEVILIILLSLAMQVDCRCSKNTQKSLHTISMGTQQSFPQPGAPITDREWSFKAAQRGDFLRVNFDTFELGGPECGENNTRIETVNVEINENGQTTTYMFCKDRGPYVEFSSLDTLKVSYCNRYMSGNIRFTVTSGCSSRHIVSNKTAKLQLRRNNQECWVALQSLTGGRIDVKIQHLAMREARTTKCRSSYIIAKGYESTNSISEKIIKLHGRNRYCFVLNGIHTKDIHFISEYPIVNITYKRADFLLLFSHTDVDLEIPDGRQVDPPVEAFSTPRVDPLMNSTTTPLDSYNIADTQKNSLIHILALAIGGVFVIIVVIGTLCIIKKRVLPTRSSSTKSKVTKTSRMESIPCNGINVDQHSFDNSSVMSMSNAMYDQVLEGNSFGSTNVLGQSQEKAIGNETRKTSTELQMSTQRRLMELEEQYGPFSEQLNENPIEVGVNYSENLMGRSKNFSTSTNPNQEEVKRRAKPQNNYETTRRYTRPLLPAPTNGGQLGTTESFQVTENLYETIDQQHSGLQCMTNLPSYDEVPNENWENSENIQSGKQSHRIPNVQYLSKNISGPFDTPTIQVFPVLSSQKSLQDSQDQENVPYAEINKQKLHTSPSEPLLNVEDEEKTAFPSKQNRVHLNEKHHMTQSKSHSAINSKSTVIKNRPYPRPSLPELMISQKYISFDSDGSGSIGSLLQEDSDNYLKPRPSCPDVMVPCAYSSSEEISEMRIRLLKAAHPSLIGNAEASAIKNKSLYDSPRSSLDGHSSNSFSNTGHYYSAPCASDF